MKAVISLITLAFALSLCNLMGRRNNTNSNVNAPSGTATESNVNGNSNSPEIVEAPPPPESIKPQHSNSNAGVPQIETRPPPPPPKPTKPTPLPIVSRGVLNGKATKLVQPTYPPIAKAAHASGQVTVQVLVDENGNVISATPVSGHPLLKAAATAAARASKFSPTLLSGQPIKVSGVIIYNFVEQ